MNTLWNGHVKVTLRISSIVDEPGYLSNCFRGSDPRQLQKCIFPFALRPDLRCKLLYSVAERGGMIADRR